MGSSQTNDFNFPYFPPPPYRPFRPPPPAAKPPSPSRSTPPPPPPSHPFAPPPRHVSPPPPPAAKPPSPSRSTPPPPPSHLFAPPPHHVLPPPRPSPSPDNHPTVIVIVFISFGGLLFLAFLATACFCFIKKKKKKTVQETDLIHFDEHRKVTEAIIPGPHGSKAVILSVEDDVHIDEVIRKNEKVGEGLHAKSAEGISGSLEEGASSSGFDHHQLKHKA